MRTISSTPIRLTGIALVTVSLGMVVSSIVAAVDGGGAALDLLLSAGISAAIGGLAIAGTRLSQRSEPASMFAAVAWSWVAVSVVGALPFLISGVISWGHFDDALFESVSGFSCTGSTILPDLDAVPDGVLFYRSLTQWFGGMGLVVLAVAVLPALNVGGLQLIGNEAPGPTADRLTPRVRETAQRLWVLYGAATVVVAVALMIAGMGLFDGVTHAFTTVATGGFSPRGGSIADFDSLGVEIVLMVAMIYCGASFSAHWHATQIGITAYRRVSEVRWYLWILVLGFVALLAINRSLLGFADNLRESAFNAVTIGTSTGFGTSDFTQWAGSAQLILVILMLVGGMTGSTTGGIKVLRVQMMVRYAIREIVRTRHPRAVLPMRLGHTILPEDLASRAIGFFLVYVGLIVAGGVVVTALGADPLTAFSGAVSAIGNDGPALGEAGPASTFLAYPRGGRMVLAALMLFGRLEVFPTMLMFAASARYLSRRRPARSVD